MNGNQRMYKAKLKLYSCVLLSTLSVGGGIVTNAAWAAETGSVPAMAQTEASDQQAEALFDRIFKGWVSRSPTFQSYLGIKTDYDKWDDMSEAFSEESLRIAKADLQDLLALDASRLSASNQLSYQLMQQQLEAQIEDYRWRHYDYPVNQMFGVHSGTPSLLINQHSIDNVKDAEAYISRLNGVPALFDQLIEQLALRAEKGVIPPRFVFPKVIQSSRNIITGKPFGGEEDSALLADFSAKVAAAEIPEARKTALIAEANKALLTSVKPAYEKLIAYLADQEKRADDKAGVWKFPDGDAFYANALRRTTTTDMSAEEIYQLGLKEVARIHDDMRAIMRQVKFKGDLQAFFTFMREDKQFYYPETEEGKQAYLQKATALIDDMKANLPKLFMTLPKADLKVKAVEPFREQEAGKAFYEAPALEGDRPGLYYANLYKMSEMPIYEMDALAYHEGIPGHHMQISISQELDNLPTFRKFGDYTAYIEGWGLYSELLPKEMGFYQDPYADFGRLSMELWRACRLVVDTGIHAKRWTREQAIDYLAENTPNARGDVVRSIERYIVMPGQATAYKIGMLKFQSLRQKAKQELGEKFDIREYHDIVLRDGAVPLNVLDGLVTDWIDHKKRDVLAKEKEALQDGKS
ncbi:uncharacterized protein conserved in bacteria [Hahella chejuensis KCTC 2396]|uniref:Uncharacterized protein conserved in bacteria n=2 Tax=Hahella chejuensis TaxID=158327 RepID=Q2SMX0_HAHCH|nr:uncharacterized protein conserved in bacteria [Hahella chejuensis KCTC 2396]